MQNFYHIPRINEGLNLLGDATLFFKLETISGYRQAEIDKSDREYKVCVTYGLFRGYPYAV